MLLDFISSVYDLIQWPGVIVLMAIESAAIPRPSELIRRHCLTEIQGMEPVEQIVAAYGSENLFLATDFPHPEFQVLPNSVGGILDREHLSDTDKENILGGNLARVFNRS